MRKIIITTEYHGKSNNSFHLDLTQFFDPNLNYKKGKVPLLKIEEEIYKQISDYKASGFKFTHIDSYHHTHLREELLPLIIKIAKPEGLKTIRFFKAFYETNELYQRMKVFLDSNGLKTTDYFLESLNFEDMKKIPDGSTVELMINIDERKMLCDPKTKDFFKKEHYKFINFSEI
ncbi:ChbG/HpnK family deacetylase [bacterium]